MKHSFPGFLLLVSPANHSGSSGAIMYNVCTVYRGGGGGGGVFSTLADTMNTLGDIMSTSGDVQYIRRLQ